MLENSGLASPPSVDRLLRVSDDKESPVRFVSGENFFREGRQSRPLRMRGVLELVQKKVADASVQPVEELFRACSLPYSRESVGQILEVVEAFLALDPLNPPIILRKKSSQRGNAPVVLRQESHLGDPNQGRQDLANRIGNGLLCVCSTRGQDRLGQPSRQKPRPVPCAEGLDSLRPCLLLPAIDLPGSRSRELHILEEGDQLVELLQVNLPRAV